MKLTTLLFAILATASLSFGNDLVITNLTSSQVLLHTGPLTNLNWSVDEETPETNLIISTNITTRWTTVEEIRDYAPTFTISRFDLLKQVGQVSTNRVLTIEHAGTTTVVVLKVLGQQDWPMEHRTLTLPAMQPRFRPLTREEP